MLTGEEFAKKVEEYVEPLYKASEHHTISYYKNKPSLEDGVHHFKRRMVNERLNAVKIAKLLTELPVSSDPTQFKLLSRQVLDEAKHYDMVRNVIEYLSGEKFSEDEIEEEFAWQLDGEEAKSKGASLFEEFGCDEDPLMTSLYQFIAEGRSARVWDAMSHAIEDKFVSRSYAKIARDEFFHAKIGRRTLVMLCDTQEAQDRVMEVLPKLLERMYWINSVGTAITREGAEICMKHYDFEITDEKIASFGQKWFEPIDNPVKWNPLPKGKIEENNDMVDNFATI